MIKVNACHPGWVKTDMGGDSAPMEIHEGAESAVWLATLPKDGPTGGFFHKKEQLPW
ncbi:short chain dehydrogenase [compost metagenome]